MRASNNVRVADANEVMKRFLSAVPASIVVNRTPYCIQCLLFSSDTIEKNVTESLGVAGERGYRTAGSVIVNRTSVRA
jgi:hypothetical protein